MIPAATAGLPVANGGQSIASGSGSAKPEATVADQAKSSAGTKSPANAQPLTNAAVDPSRQTTVAPRLRDQETAERSAREVPASDAPTGPPPSFEETPLQRASRVIFDPPEAYLEVNAVPPENKASDEGEPSARTVEDSDDSEPVLGSDDSSVAEEKRAEEKAAATRQAEAAFEASRELARTASAGLDVAI